MIQRIVLVKIGRQSLGYEHDRGEIKKTSFVMCENGQDKLNMLDATLLKDPQINRSNISAVEISESWDEQSITGNWELGAVEYVESRRSE